MRKAGYILLFVGIVIEASSLVMVFMTNQPLHVTYGIPMIIVGWKLTRYGKGIHESNQTSEVDPANSTGNDGPSREMPLTSAVADLITSRLHQVQKATRRIAKLFAALAIVVGAIVGASVGSPDGKTFFISISGIGLIVGGVVLFASSFDEKHLRRDLSDTTYLRTRGPVDVVKIRRYGHLLRLSDRAILIDNKPAKAIKGLDWATVDYSRHAKLILAVWDRAGKPVYQFMVS
jgi:hypothetical protein